MFKTKQKYLNCKSLNQYVQAFVNFFIKECRTEETILTELDYVKNIRILFSRNQRDLSALEEQTKKQIIAGCLTAYEPKEKEIFREAAIELGFLREG